MVQSPPALRGVERAPHVVHKAVSANGPQNAAAGSDRDTPGTDMRREKKSRHQSRQPDVRKPDVNHCQRAAMYRMPEETRQHLISDAKDHHGHEPDQGHVRVCRSVNRERRVYCHRQTQRDAQQEPDETRPNEDLREPIQ